MPTSSDIATTIILSGILFSLHFWFHVRFNKHLESLGGISARNLREKDGAYYNEAWGKSAVRMTVEVRGGVGEIRLSVD